jgi:hypothetical protein
VQTNPHCFFVSDDGTREAAVVLRNTEPRAYRCEKCRTVVVIGEGNLHPG